MERTTCKLLFQEDHHHNLASCDDDDNASKTPGLVAKWCQKEKIKTSAVALVVCLNIGVDPPGVLKVSPCAKKQCWIDPSATAPQKALEAIGRNLQSQYERWQPRAKYRFAPDPTIDVVKKNCQALRKSAKTERVLFHYNGHGVPKPTDNGEIWVFNPQYTQYIPLSIYELHAWVMQPAIYVFDCPSSGTLVDSFRNMLEQSSSNEVANGAHQQKRDLMKDIVILAACRPNELLPQDPEFPADLFTACLTTPLKVALRWLLPRSLVHDKRITPDLVDNVPGFSNDRKTPFGELNWIFTAITDTIAWNVLPRELFQKLFRQDLLVASLFRNFLLAERVMSSIGVMPISYPRLPPTANHRMWLAWDMAAEQVLMQIPNLLLEDPPGTFIPSRFFAEQLDSFELWLLHGSSNKASPRQLPIVLQVLLSPVHRLRALDLLYRFLELGAWGVDLALSVGIFPYVLKLLQTTTPELQQTLICIWAKIISLDSACQHDLIKDNGHLYFVRFLESGVGTLKLKTKAVFVLTVMCDKYSKGQVECLKSGMMRICKSLLTMDVEPDKMQAVWELWQSTCLCIGKMCEGRPDGILSAHELAIQHELRDLLTMRVGAEVRAAALYTLGTMIVYEPLPEGMQPALFDKLIEWVVGGIFVGIHDGSPLVRAETACTLARLAVIPGMDKYLQVAAELLINPVIDLEAGSLVQEAASCQARLYQHYYLQRAGYGVSGSYESVGRDSRAKGWMDKDAVYLDAVRDYDSLGLLGDPPVGHQQSASGDYDPYQRVVEAMCQLATDPHPEVAKLGQEALELIEWELVPFVPATSHQSCSSSEANATGTLELPVSNPAQLQNLRLELTPRHCQRCPFTLRRRPEQDDGHQELQGESIPSETSGGIAVTGNVIPPSRIFKVCRDRAAHLRDDAWGEELFQEHGQFKITTVEAPECLTGTEYSRHEPVHLDTELDVVWCLLFDPVDPYLAVCGRGGMMHILDYERRKCVSKFHVTGQPKENGMMARVDPVCMMSLNGRGLDLIMACSADGSVRVLDGCVSEDSPKLLTALQSVVVSMPPHLTQYPAAFDWSPSTGDLFATGGRMYGHVVRINLEYQSLLARLAVDTEYLPNVDIIRTFPGDDNLVVTGLSDGMVKIFDLRVESGHVAACKPFSSADSQSFAGIGVSENWGAGRLAVLSESGMMGILDMKNMDEGVVHTIQAHDQGGATALAAHSGLGLMATATLHPVVKAWSSHAEEICEPWTYEPTSPINQGPVVCLSFHPGQPKFAAGGKGGNCSIYDVQEK